MMEQRLARVPREAVRMLELAAVIGRQVEINLLAHLLPQSNLEACIQGCAEAAVFEVHEGAWRFAHDKIREAVLADLTPQQAQKEHRLVAQTLETLYPEQPAHFGRLVYHWHVAQDQQKEQHYANLAGRHARKQYAYHEAKSYLTRALSLTPADEFETRYTLLIDRQDVHLILGHAQAREQDLMALKVLTDGLVGHPNFEPKKVAEWRAYTALHRAHHFQDRKSSLALAIAEEGLLFAQDTDSSNLEITLRLQLAYAYMNQGLYASAQAQIETTLHLVRTRQDAYPGFEGFSLYYLGLLYLERGELRLAKEAVEQAWQIVQEHNQKVTYPPTLMRLGEIEQASEKDEEAKAHFEQALSLARELYHQEYEAEALSALGKMAWQRGAYDESEQLLRQALSMSEETENKQSLITVSLRLGYLLSSRGDNEQAKRFFSLALGESQALNQPILVSEALSGMSHFAHRQGQLEEALTYSRQALAITQKFGMRLLELDVLMGLGQLLRDIGKPQDALNHYTDALALCHALGKARQAQIVQAALVEIRQSRSAKSAPAQPDAPEKITAKMTTPDLETQLTDTLAQAIQQVDAERGVILLRQADGQERVIKSAQYGQDSISRTIINKVIQTNTGIVVRNAMTDRHFARVKSVMKGRIRSVLCVPLIEKEQGIGAIYLEHRRKRGKFSQQDLSTVTRLGQQLMSASPLMTKAKAITQQKELQALPPREGNLSEKPKSPHNRYILHEQLGQGGMGMVHRATDRLTGEIVALKQVRVPVEQLHFMSRPDTLSEHYLRMALAQEFQIVASLRHPHIISVLNYGFGPEQQPYFTMTYLPKAQTILEAGMTRDTVGKVQLIREMLQALAYLHRRGIVHHDLKPSNVLVAEAHVRLLDFGLSISQNSKLTSAGGTLLYMAPELLNQEAATQASDLYAVGVMAYQLFAGRHPFDPTSYAFLDQVLNEAPDLTMLGLEQPLANVIAQLLAKTPAERFASAERCLQAIHTALGNALPAESAAIRESYLQAATFVGREAEMAQLQTALTDAEQGQGSVWLIGGESGVGKSRLIEEFRTHALVSGWQVLTGQAITEGGRPYHLWRNIVPSLLLNTELNDLDAGVLKQIVPKIDQLLGRNVAPPPEMSGEAGQQRLILTIISILQRQSQPTLLLLEDLQWAQTGLAPLKQMLIILEKLPKVMVVGTYRNDEASRLPDTLPGVHTLTLDRLSEAQIETLSQAMLGESGTSPHIVSLLTQETEGNTFFIVEVMRALAEEAGNLDEIGRMTLPHEVFTRGMHHLLKRRIQKVGPKEQKLLLLAAVAGRKLDTALLQQLKPEQKIEAWLHRLTEASILTVREGEWFFAHDKLREVILQDLTESRRCEFHQQVAEAIEQLYPNNASYNPILLQHWYQAHHDEKVMLYLLPVAQNLIEITADYEEALKWLEIGLQIQSEEDSRRVSLWNWQAKVYLYQGNYGAVMSASQQAERLASQLNDKRGLAKSLTNTGILLDYQGDYDRASKKLKQSLTLYQEIGDKTGIASTLDKLGRLASEIGSHEQTIHLFQQSLSLYQEIRDQHGIARCFLSLANLALDHNDFKEAIDYTQQSLMFFKGIGDQRNIANCLAKLGICARYQKKYKQAIDYLQQALSLQKAIGNQTGTSIMLNNLGRVAYLQGDYQQAIEYAQESLVIRKANGYKYGQVFCLLILGFAYVKLKKVAARETFWQALSISQSIHSNNLIQAAIAGFAWLYQQTGQPAQAAELTSLVKWNDAVSWLDGLHPLLEESLGVAGMQAALARGNTLDLAEVTQALLDKFSPEK